MWAPGSRCLLLALAMALAVGCAAGPDFVRPAVPGDAGYLPPSHMPGRLEALGQTQQFDTRASLKADWWRLFKSPPIDSMVSEALTNNPNLQGAQAALRQSQDNLRAGAGVFFPQVGLGLAATRQRQTPARFGLGGAGGIFNLFTLGTTVSYALDIFGGERRTVEALRASVDVQRYVLLGTDLTLTANVVNTALAREAYAEQLAVTRETARLQREQLSITRTRVDAGTVPYSAVDTLRSALATTKASMAALSQRYDQASHALSLLLGKTPERGDPRGFMLDSIELPAALPLSVPSDLVRQRPDILAAESQLHVATAGVGVATAGLFPTFTLSGSYGGESSTFGAMDSARNRFWATGASTDWPVLQGGTAWYRREAAREAYRVALSDYRAVVLAAFAQVADTLNALQHDAEALTAEDEATHAAEEALRSAQANYEAGVAGYLDLLVADQQLQQTRMAYIQALAQRYQDTVALFTALGGGWWNASPGGAQLTDGAEVTR